MRPCPIIYFVIYFGIITQLVKIVTWGVRLYPDHWLESNMSIIYTIKLICNHIYPYAMLSQNYVGTLKALRGNFPCSGQTISLRINNEKQVTQPVKYIL